MAVDARLGFCRSRYARFKRERRTVDLLGVSITDAGKPTTWLCPTEADRERLLDMTLRILWPTAGLAIICLPFTVLLAIRVGIVVLGPYVLAALVVVIMGTVLPQRRRPEIWLFGFDLLVVAAIAIDVALSGGSGAPGISLVVWPIIAVAGRHTQRSLFLHVALTIVAVSAACAFAINRTLAYGELRLLGLLTCIVGVVLLAVALTRAEREAREQSLVDPLTGVLNRLALSRRVEELEAQASHGPGSLCVIAADIDHFKNINDTHGHDRGDAVLRGIADSLRTNLRAFPLLYRTGGEEFMAMLPGLNCDEGRQVAERLRTAVERACPSDIPVTMSFGVATSNPGRFDPTTVMTAADRCLYQAKRGGRNRVVAEDGALICTEMDRAAGARRPERGFAAPDCSPSSRAL